MSRTTIDLDDTAVARVMERHGFTTERDAVNFALRAVAVEPLDLEGARALRGGDRYGDLDRMREAGVG